MCVVSMVHEHFQRYPDPIRHDYWEQWTWPRWDEYQELLRKAAEYDRLMKQADCPDPKKEERMKQIEEFLIKNHGYRPER